jgi:hypothetical protein
VYGETVSPSPPINVSIQPASPEDDTEGPNYTVYYAEGKKVSITIHKSITVDGRSYTLVNKTWTGGSLGTWTGTNKSLSRTWTPPLDAGDSFSVYGKWVPVGEGGGGGEPVSYEYSASTSYVDASITINDYIPYVAKGEDEIVDLKIVGQDGTPLVGRKISLSFGSLTANPVSGKGGIATHTFSTKDLKPDKYKIIAKKPSGVVEDSEDVVVFVVEIENKGQRDSDDIQIQNKINSAIPAKIYYKILPKSGWAPDSVTLKIKSGGTVIRSQALSKSIGEQNATWNGKNNSGKYVNYGDYKVIIEVTAGDSTGVSNEHDLRVYMVRLGNIVYYDILLGINEHAGIIYSYYGKNTLEDLQNDNKYSICEIKGPGSTVGISRTLKDFKACSNYEGIYCPPGLSKNARANIIQKCNALKGKPYVDGFPPIVYVLQYKGETWNGTISDIDKIRCDGVSEVAYESSNIRLFGSGNAWNIMTSEYNLEHHNAQCTPEDQRHGGATTNSTDQLYFP